MESKKKKKERKERRKQAEIDIALWNTLAIGNYGHIQEGEGDKGF